MSKTVLVVTSRIDIKSLAELTLYYAKNKLPPSTKGGLISRAIDDFSGLLASSGKIDPIETDEKAIAVIQSLGIEVKVDKEIKKDLNSIAEGLKKGIIPDPSPTGFEIAEQIPSVSDKDVDLIAEHVKNMEEK